MKIAYVTDFDVLSVSERTNHHPKATGQRERCYRIAQSLEADVSTTVNYLGPLNRSSSLLPKIKWRFYHYLLNKNYHYWAEKNHNKYYAEQILRKLASIHSDVVLSPDINYISYLNCDLPIVLWTDTLYIGLINSYPYYSNLCKETAEQLVEMDRLILEKCDLAIFSSDWAAKAVITEYQVAPSKVKVVPFGANIDCNWDKNTIQNMIESRPVNKCKLLFVGAEWHRKGGDVALEVARSLNARGLETELTVVGCNPIIKEDLADFVKVVGFINKSTNGHLLNKLFAESHLMILPSKADCSPAVLRDASAFGLPCISTEVGGIPTIIKEGLNGKLFASDAEVSEYCTYIYKLFDNYTQYKQLALSSFNEYQTRLNWLAAGQTVKKMLMEVA